MDRSVHRADTEQRYTYRSSKPECVTLCHATLPPEGNLHATLHYSLPTVHTSVSTVRNDSPLGSLQCLTLVTVASYFILTSSFFNLLQTRVLFEVPHTCWPSAISICRLATLIVCMYTMQGALCRCFSCHGAHRTVLNFCQWIQQRMHFPIILISRHLVRPCHTKVFQKGKGLVMMNEHHHHRFVQHLVKPCPA